MAGDFVTEVGSVTRKGCSSVANSGPTLNVSTTHDQSYYQRPAVNNFNSIDTESNVGASEQSQPNVVHSDQLLRSGAGVDSGVAVSTVDAVSAEGVLGVEPPKASSNSHQKCRVCKVIGYSMWTCSQLRSRRDGDAREKRCFRCRCTGHCVKQCVSVLSSIETSIADRRSGLCYFCHKGQKDGCLLQPNVQSPVDLTQTHWRSLKAIFPGVSISEVQVGAKSNLTLQDKKANPKQREKLAMKRSHADEPNCVEQEFCSADHMSKNEGRLHHRTWAKRLFLRATLPCFRSHACLGFRAHGGKSQSLRLEKRISRSSPLAASLHSVSGVQDFVRG